MDEKDTNPVNKESISHSPGTSQQTKSGDEPDSKPVTKDGSESPARCPICLATPQNDAKSDSCSHNFCFGCLKEWCKVKAECPLCKMPIHSIFYNIKSDAEYDEYKVKVPKPDMKHNMFAMPDFSFNWWQSTFRREYFRRRRETDIVGEAANDVGSIRRRRMYYWNKSKVLRVNTRNRVRECSAEFFSENPSQIHRLVPWLRRELTVLYGSRNKNLIDHLFKKIIDVLPYVDINSRQFKLMIQDYMLEYTDQFIHELLSFARSPYDVSQYDQAADYGMNGDRMSQQQSRRKNRSRQHRTAGSSRWDNSPDNLPLGASAQSMMLSQTTWSEEPPQTSLMHGVQTLGSTLRSLSSAANGETYMNSNGIGLGFNLSPPVSPSVYPSFHGPLSYRLLFSRDMPRDIDAPLQQQTMDLYRHGGSSARQYQSMERRRQHIGNYQRAVSNSRRKYAEIMNKQVPSQSRILTTIVISDSSDSSEGENVAGTSSGKKVSTTIHYKPADSQTKVNETQHGKVQVKKEKSRHHSSSSDSTTLDTSDSDDDSSSSGIEFVRYIKPPHLRTPDAYINLSSTDEDTPGPSSKLTTVIKPNFSATYCTSLPNSDDRNSRIIQNDVLTKTKEFLQKARNVSQECVNEFNAAKSEDTPFAALPPNTSSQMIQETADHSNQRDESLASPNLSVTNAIGDDNVSDQRDSTLKKIFEKGKVSINFPSTKRPYSSSDSEIDVDYIEEVPISTKETPSQNASTSDFHDNDTQQGTTLKSVISIPGNPVAVISIPEASVQQEENAHYSTMESNNDQARHSNESMRRERHKRRKRKLSRHGESNHDIKHSRRHKKHKKRRTASRSSSVEFVNETRLRDTLNLEPQ